MVDQRRPSGQSLILDLEGLDLGGPVASSSSSTLTSALRRPQQPSFPSSRSDSGDGSIRPASNGHGPSQGEDSFAAHLRADCIDSQEIYSADTMIMADGAARQSRERARPFQSASFNSGPLTRPIPSYIDPEHEGFASSCAPNGTVDLSHQVLGGFASLGLSSMPGSNTHSTSQARRESFLQATTTSEQDTAWRPLRPTSCDPMDALDVLSIEEMGQLAISIGSRDEWDGLILSPVEAPSRCQDSSASLNTMAASWTTARSVQGQRRWICAPAASKNPAARTVIVSDRGLDRSRGPGNRPHAAFSGLASFEMRFLRSGSSEHGGDSPATPLASSARAPTISLAPARTLKSQFSHLALGQRRRRAESLTRAQLPSPRRNPSDRPTSSRGDAEPALRRTRSRPAIKIGSLNKPEEAARHERHLIDSLAAAGILTRSSRPATPSDVHRGSLDERALAEGKAAHAAAKVSKQLSPHHIDLSGIDMDAMGGGGHHFPGEGGSPFSNFTFGERQVPLVLPGEEPSPKSPVSELPPPSLRPVLLQTVSDQTVPARAGDEPDHPSMHRLAADASAFTPSSSPRTRKEGSRLTGWLKKRISGNGSSSPGAGTPSTTGRGEASTRRNNKGFGSNLTAPGLDAIEYSSDVTHDRKRDATMVLPQSQSHSSVLDGAAAGMPAPPPTETGKWSLQGSLLAKSGVGRRASASDDQLVAVQGQAARKTALGASQARRPSKDVGGLAAAAASSRRTSNVQAEGSSDHHGGTTKNGAVYHHHDPQQQQPKSQQQERHRHASVASSSLSEDPLGLEDVPPEALVMVLPLPLRRAAAASQSQSQSQSYLRLAFVPFAPRGGHRDVGKTGASPMTTTTTAMGVSSAVGSTVDGAVGAGAGTGLMTAQPSSQWYRRLGRSLAEADVSMGGSTTGHGDGRHSSSGSSVPEPLLFGAGPARRSEATSTKLFNRRTSYVQAFRVTGLVISVARTGTPSSPSPSPSSAWTMRGRPDTLPLPPPGSFPVVLAVCMEEQSLEFMPEGWAALGLERGPSDDGERDPMFGVADAIIAACAAIMDL